MANCQNGLVERAKLFNLRIERDKDGPYPRRFHIVHEHFKLWSYSPERVRSFIEALESLDNYFTFCQKPSIVELRNALDLIFIIRVNKG